MSVRFVSKFGEFLQRRFGTPYELNAADQLSEAPIQGVFELDKEIIVPSQRRLINTVTTDVTMLLVGSNPPGSGANLWGLGAYDQAVLNTLMYEITNGTAGALNYDIRLVYTYADNSTHSRRLALENIAAGASLQGYIDLPEELIVFARDEDESSSLITLRLRVIPQGAGTGSIELTFAGYGRLADVLPVEY